MEVINIKRNKGSLSSIKVSLPYYHQERVVRKNEHERDRLGFGGLSSLSIIVSSWTKVCHLMTLLCENHMF
jgi:hypothetical protein